VMELYYIQSQYSCCGNCVSWWAVDGKGYTCDLKKAWKVTLKQAESICSDKSRRERYWLVSEIDARAKLHFDFQLFREIEKA
jgi:hypothetical protein